MAHSMTKRKRSIFLFTARNHLAQVCSNAFIASPVATCQKRNCEPTSILIKTILQDDSRLMRNRLSKRRLILRGALIGLIIIVVLSGIGLFLLQSVVVSIGDVMAPATGVIQKTDVKNYIGLSLPIEATNFHGMYYAFLQSRIIAFSFQSSPKILDSFLKQLGFKDALKTGLNPLREHQFPEITKFDWRNTKNISHFAGASWTKPETFYDVVVDTADAQNYIVYMMVEQG